MYQGVKGVAAGPGYVQTAMENIMPGFGSVFVAVALFFFAFTTIMAYYYIAETNIRYLTRSMKLNWAIPVLKVVKAKKNSATATNTAPKPGMMFSIAVCT